LTFEIGISFACLPQAGILGFEIWNLFGIRILTFEISAPGPIATRPVLAFCIVL
jgi:hypothetical protein